MSHTYKAGDDMPPEMRAEHNRLERALNDPQPDYSFKVAHGEPNRIRGGMVVFADGANWNPGYGAGLYARNEANTAWEPLTPKTYSRYFMLMGA